MDISRRISKRANNFPLEQYQNQIHNGFANNEEHKFIEDLRNYVCHYNVVEANWQINYSINGRTVEFLLYSDQLLEWKGWSSLAKSFIKKNSNGINVENLFKNYKIRVKEFQNWFYTSLEKAGEPNLSEYRNYERLLKKLDSKCFWDMMFSQVIPGKIDPYKYIDLHLTDSELNEVLSLPSHSQQQVDRIIEIIDEYGICDQTLREKVYSAFQVIVLHSKRFNKRLQS